MTFGKTPVVQADEEETAPWSHLQYTFPLHLIFHALEASISPMTYLCPFMINYDLAMIQFSNDTFYSCCTRIRTFGIRRPLWTESHWRDRVDCGYWSEMVGTSGPIADLRSLRYPHYFTSVGAVDFHASGSLPEPSLRLRTSKLNIDKKAISRYHEEITSSTSYAILCRIKEYVESHIESFRFSW